MSSEATTESTLDYEPAIEILKLIVDAARSKDKNSIGIVEATHKTTGVKMLVVCSTDDAPNDKVYITPLFFVDPEKKMMAEFDINLGDSIIKAEKH